MAVGVRGKELPGDVMFTGLRKGVGGSSEDGRPTVMADYVAAAAVGGGDVGAGVVT